METPQFNNRFFPRVNPSGGGPDAGPWDQAAGVVYPDNAGWTVVIGAAAMSGSGETLRVVGGIRTDDPGSNAYLEFGAGDLALQSNVGEARIRYNAGTTNLEISENGGAYVPISSPSGGGWTDIGAVVRLTTTSDNVTIGAVAMAGTEKLRVTGAILADGVVGAVPVAGAGTRLMWAPAKAALRAGTVTATEWDNASVGQASAALNTDTIASGANSFAVGNGSDAEAAHSSAFGRQARAARIGQRSISNGAFTTVGDSQSFEIVARRQTPDATPIELTLDGAVPAGAVIGTSNRIILADDTTYTIHAEVVARNTAASEHKSWELKALIKRDVGAATVLVVSPQMKSVIGKSTPAANTWDANLLADAVNGSLRVEVTGQAGKTIKWTGWVRATEVAA